MTARLGDHHFRSILPRAPLSAVGLLTLVVSAPAPALAGGTQRVEPDGVRMAEASSAGEEGEPRRAVDGRVGTAWITPPNAAVGQTLTLRFAGTRYISQVDVQPGHGKDNNLFKFFARPRRIELSWDGGQAEFDLDDKRRMQPLVLPVMARTTWLTLKVLKASNVVRKGLAIAEVVAHEPRSVISLDPSVRARIEADLTSLTSPDDEDAIERMIAHGEPAIPWLATRAKTGSGREAAGAAVALRALDRPAATDALRGQLESPDRVRRIAALRALDDEDAKGLRDILHRLATSPTVDSAMAPSLTAAFARSGDPRAAKVVEAAAEGGDEMYASLAVAWLPRLGHEGLLAAQRMAANANPIARQAGVRALGSFRGSSDALGTLKVALGHEDPATQLAAIAALGRIGSEAARAILSDLVESNLSLQEAGLRALAGHGEDALPLFKKLLASAGPDLQQKTFKVLGTVRTEGVRALLVQEVLVDPPASWTRYAIKAFATHGASGVEALIEHLRENPGDSERARAYLNRVATDAAPLAAEVLGGLLPTRALDKLRLELLTVISLARYLEAAPTVLKLHEDPATSAVVRRACLATMGALPTQEVKDLVIEEMDSRSTRTALIAMRSAALLKDARAIPKLLERMHSMNRERWTVEDIEALGLLEAMDAVPMFEANWDFLRRRQRLAVLKAVARIGGARSVGMLVEASTSTEHVISRLAKSLLVTAK